MIRSEIRCKPNHKDYYLRSDLDVMVADISPLFGTPTFLYKMIDDFKSPPEGDQFIIPKNKIIYNPAGFYENGWTEDLNEISRDAYDRMEGLANQRDLNELKDLIMILGGEWANEGFENEDIVDYFEDLVYKL